MEAHRRGVDAPAVTADDRGTSAAGADTSGGGPVVDLSSGRGRPTAVGAGRGPARSLLASLVELARLRDGDVLG